MPPQKQDNRRIQIIHSQQLLLLSQPLLLPQPPKKPPLLLPQQENKRIIQIQLLQLPPKPRELFPQLLEQPQLVAVKSLIFSASKFCYGLYYVGGHVNVSPILKKYIKVFLEDIYNL